MDALLSFESDRQRDEWASGNLTPSLAHILLDIAHCEITQSKEVLPLVVVNIYRTPVEDAALHGHGIHPLWRAIDLRVPSRAWNDPWGLAIAAWVNGRWAYDTVCSHQVAYFEPHGTGPHLHLQVGLSPHLKQ